MIHKLKISRRSRVQPFYIQVGFLTKYFYLPEFIVFSHLLFCHKLTISACDDYTYGVNCSRNCNRYCDGVCDKASGVCPACKPGWTGRFCTDGTCCYIKRPVFSIGSIYSHVIISFRIWVSSTRVLLESQTFTARS